MTRLREAIAAADALLVATPEYNSSIPGQLKNAFDWASRPLATSVLRNKPVAVIGASTGAFGAVWSQAELRKVLGAAGARVLDVELAVGHAAERFGEDGRLADPELREQLRDDTDALAQGDGARAVWREPQVGPAPRPGLRGREPARAYAPARECPREAARAHGRARGSRVASRCSLSGISW